MAHLFEHMFFKGSKRFPGADEISTHVTGLGGYSNAGTIYDSTNYYFVLPSEGFAKGMEIQADAIANPLFDPDELKREAEVVIENPTGSSTILPLSPRSGCSPLPSPVTGCDGGASARTTSCGTFAGTIFSRSSRPSTVRRTSSSRLRVTYRNRR